MARTKRTALKSSQYSDRMRKAIHDYSSYEREEGKALGEVVARFETLWHDCVGYHATQYGGIRKLIELMPESWKDWLEATSRRFTWFEPKMNRMDGDMRGFLNEVKCALTYSRAERPPSMEKKEDEIVWEDKHMNEIEPVAGNEVEAQVGMVPGFEDDYVTDLMDDDEAVRMVYEYHGRENSVEAEDPEEEDPEEEDPEEEEEPEEEEFYH